MRSMRSTAADPTSPATSPTGSISTTTGYAVVVLAALWLACLGVLQWSVVRFRLPIVLTLTLGAVGLGIWLWRPTEIRSAPPWLVPGVLRASVATTWTVPLFSYLRGGSLTAGLVALSVVGVGAAALLVQPSAARARTAYGLAVLGHVVTAAIATVGDPAPRIDV